MSYLQTNLQQTQLVQWLSTTSLRAACGSQASFVWPSAVFQ